MRIQYEQPQLKGQPFSLGLIYIHCLMLNIQINLAMVNLGSSFEHDLGMPHITNAKMPTPKVISLLVLEEKIFYGFVWFDSL